MRKQIHVAMAPVTGTIYAGTLLKDGRTWSTTNRTDVTIEAIVAVANYVLKSGNLVEIFEEGGRPVYRITVERL